MKAAKEKIEDVEAFTIHDFAHLGIKGGYLCWKGKRLETEQHIVLSLGQKVVAFLVSISSILTPLIIYFGNLDKICINTNQHAPFCEAQKEPAIPGITPNVELIPPLPTSQQPPVLNPSPERKETPTTH